MSKEAEARVRNELLQGLYTGMLRCTLALAGAGMHTRDDEAVAAGVSTNLLHRDLLLLPPRGGEAFRAIRGLAARGDAVSGPAQRAAGVGTLPRGESQGVAFAIGAATAAAHAGEGALVCVVLPGGAPASAATPRWKQPETWADAAVYAARTALPVIFVSFGTGRSTRGAHLGADLRPTQLYPAIPVDRQDALAVYRVAFECVSRAREGFGPSRIECVPYKVAGAESEGLDALGRVEAMLRRRGAFSKVWRRQLERQLIREHAG